jgi:hypothetical protein
MLELWFIFCVPQLVVLVWQALQSIAAPFNNCASGIWLPGFAKAP